MGWGRVVRRGGGGLSRPCSLGVGLGPGAGLWLMLLCSR